MSDDISISYIKKIVNQDKEITKTLDPTYRDIERSYRVLNERLNLYTQALKLPVSDIALLFLDSVKSTILAQMTVIAARKDFDEQTSQIVTRLDKNNYCSVLSFVL
jgi:hypothetical protein